MAYLPSPRRPCLCQTFLINPSTISHRFPYPFLFFFFPPTLFISTVLTTAAFNQWSLAYWWNPLAILLAILAFPCWLPDFPMVKQSCLQSRWVVFLKHKAHGKQKLIRFLHHLASQWKSTVELFYGFVVLSLLSPQKKGMRKCDKAREENHLIKLKQVLGNRGLERWQSWPQVTMTEQNSNPVLFPGTVFMPQKTAANQEEGQWGPESIPMLEASSPLSSPSALLKCIPTSSLRTYVYSRLK